MDPTGVVVGLPPSEPTPHAHAHPPTHPHANQRRRKKKNLCESPGCTERALLRRPRTNQSLCRECFYLAFETEVHETILAYKLFDRGDRVALCASGGKDSTVLAHVVTLLNARYDYGLDLCLLSIDEGISGYRDDSLDTVKRNEKTYGVPLHVFSYKDLYGWTMDEIVAAVGTRNNCTFCGVFRRQALDRGAHLIGVTKMATGHNADDIAETVLLNMLRNDVPRLGRCGSAVTGGREGEEGEDEDEDEHEEGGAGMHSLPRVKPFKRTYEKEIVMYAYFKKLDYFSTVRSVVLSLSSHPLTRSPAHSSPLPPSLPPPPPPPSPQECKYAPHAARGLAREFVKDLEAARPRAILDLVKSADRLELKGETKTEQKRPGTCTICGYLSSQEVCKACLLLEGLNKGMPMLGIANGRRRHRRKNTRQAKDPEKHERPRLGVVECGQGGCGQGGCGQEKQTHLYEQSMTSIAKHPMGKTIV